MDRCVSTSVSIVDTHSDSGIRPICIQILALTPNNFWSTQIAQSQYPNLQDLNGIIIVLRVMWGLDEIIYVKRSAQNSHKGKSSLATVIIASCYLFDRDTARSYTGCTLHWGPYLSGRFIYLLWKHFFVYFVLFFYILILTEVLYALAADWPEAKFRFLILFPSINLKLWLPA